jgi:hypothetical protein
LISITSRRGAASAARARCYAWNMRRALRAVALGAFAGAMGCITQPARQAARPDVCARANTEAQVYKVKDFLRIEPLPGVYSVEGYVTAYDRDAGEIALADKALPERRPRRELRLRLAERRSIDVGARYTLDLRVVDADAPWVVGCALADARLAAP